MRELVVFLHAVGGDATMWRPQLAALPRGYEALPLDLVRPAAEVGMAAFADDVAAAIARAGHAKAHLVGLSMGGVVALETFRRHRARVASLALANTWAWQPDGAARLAWFEGELAKGGLAPFSRASLPGLFAPSTDRAIVEATIAVESAKDPAMYAACWREMLGADLRDVLPRIDVPVLLVGGALDAVTPTSLLEAIAREVPTARLVDLPGAAHFSNLDAPDAWNALLATHLRTARPPADTRLGGAGEGATVTLEPGTTAAHFLRLLDARGVELLASNSGTDFTPIIDALAGLDAGSLALRIVAAPHENTCIALAHGHALLSRRPQAVMAHVNVGTANSGLGLINARRAHVPLLAVAGRTPWYEEGMPGVRTNFVQWGQETFDQGAMFREFTKWDHELRTPHALDMIVDRALAIAASEPRGPVYLTLPKEPLSAEAPARTISVEPRQRPARPTVPDAGSLEAARHRLEAARRPVIVTADLGRHAGGAAALVRFAERWGAGVVEHGKRNFFNFPTEHAHHLGFDPTAAVREADLIVAVECPVPYIPAFARLAPPPPILSIAVDPLFGDLPLRGFPSDLSLAGDPVETLRALAGGARRAPGDLAATHEATFGKARAAARADGSRERITKAHLSLAIGEAIDDDVVIFNEYDCDPLLVPRRVPDSWFENSVASGLGWSLGAALGAKLAAPERTMVVTLGDGSYLFNTPLSAHHVAASERLPFLVVVFDDQAWSTIKRSTRGSHPDGPAARNDRFALCDFPVGLAYDQIARACGGVGLRAERPSELPGKLAEALATVRGGTQALLQVMCERDG